MAPPAAERRDGRSPDLGALPRSDARADGVRAEAGADLRAHHFVTEYYQTPDAALSAYIVFFLNKPDRTTSIILSIAIVLIVTFLIGLLLLLAILVLDSPSWRVVTIALVSFVFLFLGAPASSSRSDRCWR